MLFDALDSKGQNSIRWQMFCCFESSSIVNKTDFICQIVLGSGFALLFYALDYSSFQDQDVVLVDSHQLLNARGRGDHAAVLRAVAS